MRNNKALAQNTAIQIGGKMLAVLFGILTVAVLSRYLGPTNYGHLTLILTFLSIFAVVVDFGLTLTTVQMISEHKANEETLLGNLMAMRVFSAIVFLALAPIVAIWFPYEDVVKIGIGVGAISYLFGTTAQMLIGVFQKRLIIGRAVIAELLNRTVVLVGVALAPTLGLDLIDIMWLFVVGNFGQLASIFYFAGKHVRIRFKFNWNTWGEIIRRSWPIGASIFFNLIYLRGDVLFLSFYRDAAEIGQYGAAYKVVDVITVVPVMYMGLILPMLVAAWSKNKKKTFNESLQDAFNFFSLIAVPFAFGAIALGVPVMEFISGPEYTQAGEVLKILGPAASIVFFGALTGHAIVGLNKQKPMVLGYFAVAVITVLGYLLFIPTYGIFAAAWWTLIAEILIGLITFAVVIKVADFKPQLKTFFQAGFAAIVMFIALTLLPPWHVLILIALGCTVYYTALVAVGGPKVKDALRLFLPEKPPIAQP